ncbi:sialomucin core protein 24-like isoform X2 [Ruditapes philippinarum]|uniref:sialomucin core protein 24-like isoform X2 n=1 Tax=Ruditapes philippinarum TaxID=129788 RepID=UPI00295AFAEC|nr:sialomucin core protein 24-like isoform X2 [Ruditapes philippinarum]
MKYLAVILILCVGNTVRAAPALDLEDGNDLAINVTLIPMTTGGAATINPATGQTVSAASMPPASGKTDTAPTIGPITSTPGSAIPVTIITLEPTTPATIVPIVTTLPPGNPTPAPQKGFDGGSFGGGIALGIGLCIIIFVVYRVYASRRQGGYRTM